MNLHILPEQKNLAHKPKIREIPLIRSIRDPDKKSRNADESDYADYTESFHKINLHPNICTVNPDRDYRCRGELQFAPTIGTMEKTKKIREIPYSAQSAMQTKRAAKKQPHQSARLFSFQG